MKEIYCVDRPSETFGSRLHAFVDLEDAKKCRDELNHGRDGASSVSSEAYIFILKVMESSDIKGKEDDQ